MKYLFLALISVMLVLIGSAQTTKTYYTCVMHPEVKMDKPGKCPKCGMTLVKKTIKVAASKQAPQKTDVTPKPKQPVQTEEKEQMDMDMQAHDHNEMDSSTNSGVADEVVGSTVNLQPGKT